MVDRACGDVPTGRVSAIKRSSLRLSEVFGVRRCAALKAESFSRAAAKVLTAVQSPVLLNTRVENSPSLQPRGVSVSFLAAPQVGIS